MKFLFSLLLFSSQSFAYNIDPQQITVSGLSSGAYMAGQVHVAFSSTFSNIAILAGGPYYCSLGSLGTGLMSCTNGIGQPDLPTILRITHELSNTQQIDDIENLKKSNVFVLSGQNDTIVNKKTVEQAIQFYKELGNTHIHFVDTLPAGHTFPTLNFGNACEVADTTPFIGRCGYDTVSEMFNYFFKSTHARTTSIDKNFRLFSQSKYTESQPSQISMADQGVAYVPTNCQNNETCGLHVAFHGCRQTTSDIQDTFYKNTGYAEWAEANQTIVIFPQAAHNDLLNNPKGCWDWWGYTGPNFHTKNGPQMKAVYRMVQDFSQKNTKY